MAVLTDNVNKYMGLLKVNTRKTCDKGDKPIKWLLTDDTISEYWHSIDT